MKKQDIEKILKEADDKLGNLSDKQINQYTSTSHKLQNKIWQKKGGDTIGPTHFNNGTGLFAMNEEEKRKACSEGGKVIGDRNAKSGKVSEMGKISAKSPKHPNNVKMKCEHCGFETSLPLYKRWHGDNCKQK